MDRIIWLVAGVVIGWLSHTKVAAAWTLARHGKVRVVQVREATRPRRQRPTAAPSPSDTAGA